jgi:GlpG protein
VVSLYRAWRSGDVSIQLSDQSRPSPLVSAISWRSVPVTAILILFSVAGFLIIYLRAPVAWLGLLTFSPFELVNGKPVFDSIGGQYWRLVTPAFLHFGWLHIVFNSLWLWELGGKVERVMGHMNMFGLFLVIATVSNASQFAFGGPGLFGGMSGVVYGLLGFSWVAPLLQPAWRIQPSPTLMSEPCSG